MRVKGTGSVVFALLIFLVQNSNVTAQESETSGKENKILSFPADRSMGIINVGKSIDTPFDKISVFGQEFESLGPAQGDIQVPADRLIRLDVSLDACRDLSPLGKLPADALHLLYFNIDSPIDNQLQHISHLTGLRLLFLRSCPVTDEGMQHLSGLTNLEWFRCSAYGHTDEGYGITDKSMPIFQNMKNLKRLYLRSNPITDEGLISLSHCDALQALSLDASQVTGKGLDALLMLPDLTSISFGVYNEGAPIDDDGMEVLGQLEQLKYLDLSATKITDEGFRHISSLVNLENLSLDNTAISDEGLRHLAGLEKLDRIRFYRKGTDLGDVAAEYLSKVPNLRKITTNWNVTGAGIEHLSKLKKLESIDFSRTITDADLANIAKMTGLKDLGFQNCNVTDAGIARLLPLTNLEHFSLHGTKATESCLKTLVQLPKLKLLRLGLDQNADAPYHWPNEDWSELAKMQQLEYLTVDGLLLADEQWPILTKLPGLKSLEVSNLLPLTSSFVDAVVQLPNLEILEVGRVDFTEADFARIATLNKLEYLDFSGPVGEGTLAQLAKLPALRIIQFSTDQELSDDAVADFKKNAKSLQSYIQNKWSGGFQLQLDPSGIVIHVPDNREDLNTMIGKTPPRLFGEGAGPDSEFDLAQFDGKIVVVHFWTAWTVGREPRPDEVHVRDVVSKLASEEIQVVGVHSTAGPERMPFFVREQRIPWPCFVDKDNDSADGWKTNRRRNMIYLVNRQGKVKMAQVYQGDLERALKMMLDDEGDKQAGRKRNAK